MTGWLHAASAAAVLSVIAAITVHTHTAAPNCVEMQCPSIAMDLGIQKLINEDTLGTDDCKSCSQCTANGFSVCLQLKNAATRGHRTGPTCSCAHAIPANCHNEVTTGRKPANITMSAVDVCYLSSLQAPPKPFAVNENRYIIVTVEPFWQEPYWREIELTNLTLHYEYIVTSPEHCELGELLTRPHAGSVVHTCTAEMPIPMTEAGVVEDDEGKNKGKKATDYEHSEDYENYDNELLPDIQFDREVFHNAREVKFLYRVLVNRPRQLVKEKTTDPFRDIKSEVESEALHFELKPLVKAVDPTGPTVPETPVEHESESGEFPDDTDFFAGEKKEDKEKLEQKEMELKEKEKEIEKDIVGPPEGEEEKEEEEEETEEEKKKEEHEEEEKKEEEHEEEQKKKEEKEDKGGEEKEDDNKDQSAEVDHEEGIAVGKVEHKARDEEMKEKSEEEEDEDGIEKDNNATITAVFEEIVHNNSTELQDSKENESAELEKEIEEEEEGREEEKKEEEDEEEKEDDEEKEKEEETNEEEEKSFISTWFSPDEKYGLARIVFGALLIICLFIILITCCVKGKSVCACSQPTTKTNGYTYNAANQNNRPLVMDPPERTPLNQ